MNRKILLKITAGLIPVLGVMLVSAQAQEVLFDATFEKGFVDQGNKPKLYAHEDNKPEIVKDSDAVEAGGASQGSSSALRIAGADGEPDSWKPAFDLDLGEQTEGVVKVRFAYKNASLDAGHFGLQVSNKQANSYQVYQRMRIDPGSVKVTGSGRHFAKHITSGNNSEWHVIEWSFPLPGTDSGTPKLVVDGKDQGEIKRAAETDGVESVNTIRFWLPSKRSADIIYFVDDITVSIEK